jgi:diacylglycerol kinase
LAAILLAIIIVFFAEIMNTAFEKTLDLVEPNHHPQVKLIKDMAAGAVLITAVTAVAIGLVIFPPYLLALWPR